MSSFFNKARERLEKGLKDGLQQAQDALNITGAEKEHAHTHDGACDHHHDNYDSNHRYQSFAPQTTGDIKWYVDGASYFWAVSMAIESKYPYLSIYATRRVLRARYQTRLHMMCIIRRKGEHLHFGLVVEP